MSDQGRDADERPPRPQYGEYATPEEQRSRIRQPDASWAIQTGQTSAAPAAAPTPGSAASAQRRGPVLDRVITTVLLALGLFNVITTVPGLFAFDVQLQAVLELVGVNTKIADPAGTRQWGMIAGIVMIAGFAATAFFTWLWARKGRVAFWIPLVGAIVTTIAMSACVNVPLMNDPAIEELTNRILGISAKG